MSKQPIIEIWSSNPPLPTLSDIRLGGGVVVPRDVELSADIAEDRDEPPPARASAYGFTVDRVPLPDLLDNLKGTLAQFQETLDHLPKPSTGYAIDEIELHFGVNGSGGVALIGKMEVGMEAAIKVKIKRTI